MNNLTSKTPRQIKEQMYFWFLKYHSKALNDVDGSEQFTLFDKKATAEKDRYLKMIDLQTEELPVFILTANNNEVIINTTNKFIHLTDTTSDCINYSDFEWHDGFKSLAAGKDNDGKLVSIKTNGYISEFGLRKKNGQITYWNIPTGDTGFAFWNVTKKCEIFGRKT